MPTRARRRSSRPQLEPLESRVLLNGGYAITAQTSLTTLGNGATPGMLIENPVTHDLYGATLTGGPLNYGTIFKIPAGSPAGTAPVITVATFNPPVTGFTPAGLMYFDQAGDLFGATVNGGVNNRGTLWELPAGSSTIQTLWSFIGGATGGAFPVTGVVADADGNLWGTTTSTTHDLATVFEFTPSSGTFVTRGIFPSGIASIATLAIDEDPVNPADPTNSIANDPYDTAHLGTLAFDKAGNIIGAAENGGAKGGGYLFSLSPTAVGATIAILPGSDFRTTANSGIEPIGSLIRLHDSSGAEVFVGVTSAGGTKNAGTLFEATLAANDASATVTTLASFIGTNGSRPGGQLVVVNNSPDTGPGTGSFTLYGTTAVGGLYNAGTVYRADITLTGEDTNANPVTPASYSGALNALPGETTTSIPLNKNTGDLPTGGIFRASDGTITISTSTYGLFKSGTILQLTNGAQTPADHFVFVQQPASATAGAALTQIVVRALKSTGAIDTSYTGTVALSIVNGPDGGSITGTLTATAVAGVATFPAGLVIDQAGTYSLLVTDTTATPVVAPAQGTRLTINPGKAAKLVVIQQPTVGSALSIIGPIVVQVEDANGNVVTSDGSSVALTITTGGTATSKISGNSVRAIRGIATFNAVSINEAGTFTLTATDGVLTSAVLGPITIKSQATTLVITPPAAATTFTTFEVDVTVTDGTNPAGIGSIVTLTPTLVPSKGALLGSLTATVGADGVARFHLFASVAGSYNLRASDGKIAPVTLSSPFTVS